jgi:ATP-dependent RNA helicase DeaD
VAEEGMVRLIMDVGRSDGVRPGDIVGAIANSAGIPGKAIGAIEIRQNETFIDVNDQHVDKVLTKMKRGSMKGKPVKIVRA